MVRHLLRESGHELFNFVGNGNGDADGVRKFIYRGANTPDAQPKQHRTAFVEAARLGYVECASVLLSKSDPAASDSNGWTALMCAVSSLSTSCASQLLLRSDLSAVNGKGETAFDISEAMEENKCLALIQRGARTSSESVDLATFSELQNGIGRGRARL